MSTQTVETEAQALHRLAAQAHAKDVALIVEDDNAHYVTSASRPGERHFVTLFSCDCPGFLRHRRCQHYALVLEAYHSLPPIEPDPDGGGATLPAPADVVLYVVPALSPVERHNAVVAGRYLDSPRGREETADLFADLRGEAYHRACGTTAAALAAHCERLAGEATPVLVCPSPSCGGTGFFQSHPEDAGERCDVCMGAGTVPAPVALVALTGEAVRHAA